MKKLASLFVIISFTLSAQTTKKVLFLGNSYTYVNNLPQLLADIASSNGDSLYFDNNTPGGHSLEGHATNATSLQKITSNNWDYVVLQDQSQKPSFDTAYTSQRVFPFAKALSDSIKSNNNCSIPLFYMTWGRENGDASNCQYFPWVCTYEGMQSELRENYVEMAVQNNAQVAPVGAVWREVRKASSSISLYNSDQSHPNINGSYLAACTFYASIFHKSPIGAWKPAGVSSANAQLIQNKAHSTVFDSLNTWQIDTGLPAHSTTYNITGGTQFCNMDFYAIDSVGLDSVTWDFGNGLSANGFSVSVQYSNGGLYHVISKHYKNCKYSIDTITHTACPLSISENASDYFSIYPNPTKDFIRIEHKELQQIHYSILNLSGASLLAGNLDNEKIDLSAIKPGAYILILQNESQLFYHKLIKE